MRAALTVISATAIICATVLASVFLACSFQIKMQREQQDFVLSIARAGAGVKVVPESSGTHKLFYSGPPQAPFPFPAPDPDQPSL